MPKFTSRVSGPVQKSAAIAAVFAIATLANGARAAPATLDVQNVVPGLSAAAAEARWKVAHPRMSIEDFTITLNQGETHWEFLSRRTFTFATNGFAPTDKVDAVIEPRTETIIALQRSTHFMDSLQLGQVLINSLVTKYGQPSYAYGVDGRTSNIILVWAEKFGPAQAMAPFSARQTTPNWLQCRFRAEAYGGLEQVSTIINTIANHDSRGADEETCGKTVVAEIDRQNSDMSYVTDMHLYSVDLADAHARMTRVAADFFGAANKARNDRLHQDANNAPQL